MPDQVPEPSDPAGSDRRPSPSPPDSGPLLIGPVLGVVIGYIAFRLLPDDTPVVLGLGVAVVVIAVVIYLTIEYGRWRSRRR